MDKKSWIFDPALQDIPKEKLQFLDSLIFDAKELSQKDMISHLLSMVKIGKEKNISFSKEETDLIVSVIRGYVTPYEMKKIDMVLKMKKGPS